MKRIWAALALATAGALAFVVFAPPRVTAALHTNHAADRMERLTPRIDPPAALPAVTPTPGGSDLGAFAAMTATLKTGHNIQMRTVGSVMTATYDPVHHAAMADVKNGPIEIGEIVSNGKIFVRANLGSALNSQLGITPNVWMTMDPARINATNELLVQPDASDPVDMTGIAAGITSLQKTDPTHLAGVLDLTKVSGHTKPNPDEVTKAGAPAKAVPFTVRADASGRISQFTVTADAFDPALSLDVIYTDYGSPAAITAPSTSVAAPQNLYSAFND